MNTTISEGNTKQHTPGPWTNHGEIVNAYKAEPTVNVARCSGLSPENAEANARLIAAAPELLQALLSVTACLESYIPESDSEYQHITTARAAIAKAEGRE